MIFNPIIQRELFGLLRTRRAILIQIAMVAALAFLVILRWPDDAMVDRTGEQSQQVFRLFGYGLLAAMVLMAPIFPATTIVRERRSGTLALLLNSPMSAPAIVAGKFVGVWGFSLLLILLSLPAAAACYTMGGVDLDDHLKPMYGVLLLVSIQYAAIGLLLSSFASSIDAALRITYGTVLLMAVVSLGPHQFLQGLVSNPTISSLIQWIRAVSPIPAMMEAMSQQGVGSRGLAGTDDMTKRYVILAVASSLMCLVWTAFRLNQRLMDRARAAGRITDEQSVAVRGYRRIMYLYFFDPQRRTPPIGGLFEPGKPGKIDVFAPIKLAIDIVFRMCGGGNPILIKEMRTRRFGRAHWIMRLGGVSLILSLGLMLATSWGTIDWGVNALSAVVVILQVALIVILTPALASGLFSTERETNSWQLLQMTSLSSFTIVLGKLLSAAWTLAIMLVATLPAYGIMYYIESTAGQPSTVPGVLLSLGLTAIAAVFVSAAVSSLCSRTAAATAIAYGLLVTLYAGTMLIWLGRDAPFGRDFVRKVLLFNPLAGMLEQLKVKGFADYSLIPGNWWITGAICLISIVVLFFQTRRLSQPR